MEKREVQTYTLDNGLKISTVQTESPTVAGMLRINAGGMHEEKGEEGLAHFLEHCFMSAGTRSYDPTQQQRIQNSLGYSNAFTSPNRTVMVGGFNPEDTQRFLSLTSEMASQPRYDPKAIEQQKGVVKREIGNKKGAPDFEDMRRFFWPEFTQHAGQTYFVLGEEAVIEKATPEQLERFRQRGYHPENMHLMITGELPTNLEEEIEKHFGNIPTTGKPQLPGFQNVQPLTKQLTRHSYAPDLKNNDDPTSSNSFIKLGISIPDEYSPSHTPLMIAGQVLSNGVDMGLHKRIRTEEKLAYGIGSGCSGGRKMGYFGVQGKVLATKQERAIEIIFEELQKLRTGGITQEDFENAKRTLLYRQARVGGISETFVTKDPVNAQALWDLELQAEGGIPIEEKRRALQETTLDEVVGAAAEHLNIDRETGNYVQLIRDPLKKD